MEIRPVETIITDEICISVVCASARGMSEILVLPANKLQYERCLIIRWLGPACEINAQLRLFIIDYNLLRPVNTLEKHSCYNFIVNSNQTLVQNTNGSNECDW